MDGMRLLTTSAAAPLALEWCYIKDSSFNLREDAGFLDRLRITQLLNNVIIFTVTESLLSEGGSAAHSPFHWMRPRGPM